MVLWFVLYMLFVFSKEPMDFYPQVNDFAISFHLVFHIAEKTEGREGMRNDIHPSSFATLFFR